LSKVAIKYLRPGKYTSPNALGVALFGCHGRPCRDPLGKNRIFRSRFGATHPFERNDTLNCWNVRFCDILKFEYGLNRHDRMGHVERSNNINNINALRVRLRTLSRGWIKNGLPARSILEQTADEMTQWKAETGIDGIWTRPPRMLTATLDDGSGLGLNLIEQYSTVAGMHTRRLGLTIRPETILAACRQERPDLLGLTVLQVDSEAALAEVGRGLPIETCMIAGGPAFRTDPDLAETGRVAFVARNVAYFIDFLLNWSPRENS
jgi:hypothetical protein